jgi:hypothetical protein
MAAKGRRGLVKSLAVTRMDLVGKQRDEHLNVRAAQPVTESQPREAMYLLIVPPLSTTELPPAVMSWKASWYWGLPHRPTG